MASSNYDRRPFSHQQPRRHHASYVSRDIKGYAPHDTSFSSINPRSSSSSSSSSPSPSSSTIDHPRYAATPPLPKRSSAHPYSYRPDSLTKARWPPSPSVEDEALSLARELASAKSVVVPGPGEEAQERGSIDQYPIIEEIEQLPGLYHNNRSDSDNDERRFVLVSDPVAPRQKGFAERGNMPHLRTDVDDMDDVNDNDPPVFTKRTPTPYAYTKPHKESIAPSSEYFLSPETITPPASSSIPRTVPSRDPWDTQQDQNAHPPKTTHGRYDSFNQSLPIPKTGVFEDSDADDDVTRLRTDRKPARYSFVKSHPLKEDLRTSLLDSQAKSEKRKSEQPSHKSSSRGDNESRSSPSKNLTPSTQSPRSSTSSLNHVNVTHSLQNSPPVVAEANVYKNSSKHPDSGRPKSRPSSPLYRNQVHPKPRPLPVETGYSSSNRYTDPRPVSPRPSSPLSWEPSQSAPHSPKLPSRRTGDSPVSSRPSSRSEGTPRSPSPSSFSLNTPFSHSRTPLSEADRHTTYPPTANDGSRPPTRYNDRHESLPTPMPRIGIHSPSHVRTPKTGSAPPYPMDDGPADALMPPEEAYQFDHSYSAVTPSSQLNSRQIFPDLPRMPSSPIPRSPADRPSAFQPFESSRQTANPEELQRLARIRSNSIKSQSSHDARRERRTVHTSHDRPLPSCPRSEPTDKFDDWYTLEDSPTFDMCPPCYDGVLADTPFSGYLKQTRRFERPVQRFCDFSSSWMRLAWLLTIKQRRQSLDLIFALAAISDSERPCPKDREVLATWYGIPDQRDGIHISNFSICPCDFRMIEILFPSMRGYFTRLPSHDQVGDPRQHICSLRVSSRRFPKYMDLLVELDAQAQNTGRAPDISRFIKLAREYAYRQECCRDRKLVRKPWHYIPGFPEFSVCEECYDDVVWPDVTDGNAIAKLFNRTIQLVPSEDSDGTSCCLYSPRMRRVWKRAIEDDDLGYLKRKALERKRMETRLGREKKQLLIWSERLDRGCIDWQRAKEDLMEVDQEWKGWE